MGRYQIRLGVHLSTAATCLLVAGCGAENDRGEVVSTVSIACPAVAENESCAASCRAGRALVYDPAKNCWRSDVAVTCAAPETNTFDLQCVVRASDGVIMEGPSTTVGQFPAAQCESGPWLDAVGCP